MLKPTDQSCQRTTWAKTQTVVSATLVLYLRDKPVQENKVLNTNLGTVSKIICVLFLKNSTKGGGGLVVLQVLVLEKMLKVLQTHQFIQK